MNARFYRTPPIPGTWIGAGITLAVLPLIVPLPVGSLLANWAMAGPAVMRHG